MGLEKLKFEINKRLYKTPRHSRQYKKKRTKNQSTIQWIQNGVEEDEEVGWDAGFIQANGRPVSFGSLFFIYF